MKKMQGGCAWVGVCVWGGVCVGVCLGVCVCVCAMEYYSDISKEGKFAICNSIGGLRVLC